MRTYSNRCSTVCIHVACFFISLLPQASYANTDTQITLKQAISHTLAQNPQLYQYTYIKEAALIQREISALRPALQLDIDAENFAGSGNTRDFDAVEMTLALSSVIELGDKRNARTSVADSKFNRAYWQQQAATLDVLGELTSLFIDGLVCQANIKLAQESLRLSNILLRTAKTRSSQGATPEVEVLRAKAAVTKAEIRLSALKQRFDRKKIMLAGFWGETNPQFNFLEGNLFEFGAADSFEKLFERVLNSPALQIFASEARVKNADIALARANSRSDLTWRVGIKYYEDSGDSALVAGFSVPLFSKIRSSGELKAATAKRNAVDYAKQNSTLQLRTKLYEAWSLRNQNIDAYNKTFRNVIPALENALALTQKAYENGRYRYSELVAVQEELIATKQSLIDAASNALLSQALIEQLTGKALSQQSN